MTKQTSVRIALYQPEIPQNTGNIMRLCANTGAELDLIEPLAFQLNSKSMRRAGLDYIDMSRVHRHSDFNTFVDTISKLCPIIIVSTQAKQYHTDITYPEHVCFLFGQESAGLPSEIHQHNTISSRIRIPMAPSSRSLNIANSAAVVCYEFLRQQDFKSLT